MTNVFEDESRWTTINSRFDPSPFPAMFAEMMEEWVESFPPDHPARLLYYMLPKPG